MVSLVRLRLLQGAACACFIALAACGDGGGGIHSTPTPPATPTPTPTPVPTPTPTPTPPPTNYNTQEYRNTVGAVSANAIVAYDDGATGKGIKVGIVDTGIDTTNPEFPGRIDPSSTDVAGNRGLGDEGEHGTAVAYTIAGRRNGTGAEGMAFDATLIIARADEPGSCATTDSDGNPGCLFDDTAIAKGIDLAVNNGARVINISLGGDDGADADVIAAVGRATARGVIIVVSAGNDFAKHPDTAVNPDPFAQFANTSQARGLVIIAGSVGPNPSHAAGGDTISDFSNRAGNSINHYLTAVGEDVFAPCGQDACDWSGTSFSAPQIAGAIALLAQAFPNLTPTQIISILYQSARDAGAPGPDAVYGQGVLDLTKAFSPLGKTTVAGTSTALSMALNATLSAPMGDAANARLGAVILDSYNRAFAMDLAQTINRQGPMRTLAGVLQSRTSSISSTVGGTHVAFTVAPTVDGATVSPMRMDDIQATVSRAIAGSVTQKISGTSSFAFGFATGGANLTSQLAGRGAPSFLVAQDPLDTAGFDSRIQNAAAFRQQFGRWGLTSSFETGDVLTRSIHEAFFAGLRNDYSRFGYDRAAIALDRRLGELSLGLSGTWLKERNTVLGAYFGDTLGSAESTSWFADATARFDAGGGWSFGGSMRRGWTLARTAGGIAGSGIIDTNAFAADIGKDGVFSARDSFGFRIAQPLRVSGGGIDFRLPTAYDYGIAAVSGWTTERLNLSPQGREIDAELRYAFPFWGGAMETNLFWRRDPGNFAQLPNDTGAALRWSRAF